MTTAMTVTSMRSQSSGERFFKIEQNGRVLRLPLAIAGLCADRRISGHPTACTECRVKYPVRDLNEGGYCDACACEGLLD